MAFSLSLSEPWASRGWKAKIRDRERVEPPHVSILHGARTWRLNLRSGAFMDRDPPPREVPDDVLAEVRGRMAELRSAWDEMYPENPVTTGEGKGSDE